MKKTLFTLSLIIISIKANSQYNKGFDTLYTSTNVKSEIQDLILDTDNKQYSIIRFNNDTTVLLTARNENNQKIWEKNLRNDSKLLEPDSQNNPFILNYINSGLNSGSNAKSNLLKLNKLSGDVIFDKPMFLFGNLLTINSKINLANNEFLLCGDAVQINPNGNLGNEGSFIGKFDGNGNNIWIQFLTQRGSPKMIINYDKVYMLTNGYQAVGNIKSFNLNDGIISLDYYLTDNLQIPDFNIYNNEIFFTDGNYFKKMDLSGNNIKQLYLVNSQTFYADGTRNFINISEDGKKFLQTEIYPMSSIAKSWITVFNANNIKIDSISHNIVGTLAGQYSGNTSHSYFKNTLYIVGSKIINSNKTIKAFVEINTNNLSKIEITDDNASNATCKDVWGKFYINNSGCFVLGGVQQTAQGSQFNVVKIQKYCTADAGIDETTIESMINIFPNPTSGSFKITSPTEPINSVVVFDNSGKVMYSKIEITNEKEHTIDLSNCSAGIYTVKITSDSKIITSKIALQR